MPHFLKRTDVRLGLVCAGGAVVLGLGGVLLGGAQATRPLGPALAIAVVPPVERELLPGETMEVGHLNDGFDRAALDRIADAPLPDTTPENAWLGPPLADTVQPPLRPAPLTVVYAGPDTPAPRPDPLADGSRIFGFDNPSPDYAAERRLRLEQLAPVAPPAEPTSPLETKVNTDVQPIKYSLE